MTINEDLEALDPYPRHRLRLAEPCDNSVEIASSVTLQTIQKRIEIV